MNELHSLITTIQNIGARMGAMILAEAGDFSCFNLPNKLLAYAGLPPFTYQSEQLKNCYAHMETLSSKYQRHSLFNAAKYVCHLNPTFAAYIAKNERRANTTMLQFLMLPRSWCDSSMP